MNRCPWIGNEKQGNWIHLPGVEEVFWGQNYQGEANYDAVAMIDFKNERVS